MSDFEEKLREALRPVAPREGLEQRVLKAIAEQNSHSPLDQRARPMVSSRWLAIGLAASVLCAVFLGHEWQLRHEREGLEARQQLIEALRVTSEKLDLAYKVVNSPAATQEQDSGA